MHRQSMSTPGARSADQSVYENQRQLNVRKKVLVWIWRLGLCQALCSIGLLISILVSMYIDHGVAYTIACWSIFVWLILLSCFGCNVYIQGPEKDHRRMLYCYQIMACLMIFISIPALIGICLCGYDINICSGTIAHNNYVGTATTSILFGVGLAVIVTAVLGLLVLYENSHAFGIHACLLFEKCTRRCPVCNNIIDSHGLNSHLLQHHNNVRTVSSSHHVSTVSSGHHVSTVSSGHHVSTVSSGHHVSTVSSGHHVSTLSSGHQGITTSGFEPPTYSPPAIELRIPGVDNRLPLRQPSSIQTASSHVSDDPPKYSDIVFPSEPPPSYQEVNDIIY